MSLSVGQRLGSYEILGLLGAGGMGEVYRARDTKLHRDVAIKDGAGYGYTYWKRPSRLPVARGVPK